MSGRKLKTISRKSGMTKDVTNYKIAELAYQDIRKTLEELEKKLKIYCALPSSIIVNGEEFFPCEFVSLWEWIRETNLRGKKNA